MDKDTIARLRSFCGQPDISRGNIIDIVTRKDAIERRYEADWIKTALPALLSIAERAADVEGMAQCLMLDSDVDPKMFIGMHGGSGHWGDTATAVSRYVLGGE